VSGRPGTAVAKEAGRSAGRFAWIATID